MKSLKETKKLPKTGSETISYVPTPQGETYPDPTRKDVFRRILGDAKVDAVEAEVAAMTMEERYAALQEDLDEYNNDDDTGYIEVSTQENKGFSE